MTPKIDPLARLLGAWMTRGGERRPIFVVLGGGKAWKEKMFTWQLGLGLIPWFLLIFSLGIIQSQTDTRRGRKKTAAEIDVKNISQKIIPIPRYAVFGSPLF